MNIILTGMKHTGKSTIGAQLAKRTGKRFVDTDELIRDGCGKTPRELYDEGGAELMAAKEYEAVSSLADGMDGLVVATGGALADNPPAFAALKKAGTVVYIDTPFDILFDRVMLSARRDGRLPRFLEGGDPREKFRELFARRSAVYAEMADITLLAGRKPPQTLIRELLERLDT